MGVGCGVDFELPPLVARMEDLEPNIDFELERYLARRRQKVTFSRSARAAYLAFARSPEARWTGNFRDLNASVTRLCTLASGGVIRDEDVAEEVARLRADWRTDGVEETSAPELERILPPERLAALDLFDRLQLASVVAICRRSRSLSEAGRQLFAASLAERTSRNDADRLRKYLARFGLSWADVAGV
ncbi:MAG: hypothetical protein H6697_07385 [Myxococcales bacterium]|nr:hypothetical protein [Myxococcales bacterium]MCB9520380.1 hypothetical protein [Myxococcales bacterium]